MTPRRIFLVGLSGAGKSTVGRLLAGPLGWAFADSDEEIEERTERTVSEIFNSEGEAGFRAIEADALAGLAGREPLVVSTGGGAPTDEGSRAAIGRGFVVWLAVSLAHAAERLAADPTTAARPLLAGDTQARLTALLEARASVYQKADAAVDVDSLSPEQAAAEIERLWHEFRAHPTGPGERFFGGDAPAEFARPTSSGPFEVAAIVQTPLANYPVIVGQGVLSRLGSICRDSSLVGRAFVVTDAGVGPLFGRQAAGALSSAGYSTELFTLPAGEAHKTLDTVETIYDWLLEHRVERSDVVVCLGGGVVTDMAGFAAATCLRGIEFVHVPTSLLAMVDAANGGKTGVDHPRGKNLVGAFAQPRAVVIDPHVLRTLPRRQLQNGWAEVIKHGLILDEGLTRDLEAVAGDPEAMFSPTLIARSVAIKAGIVSEDERESGRRTLLNYGHTIGHAIESVTGFSRVLHGEAVAIGMRAAGLIAQD